MRGSFNSPRKKSGPQSEDRRRVILVKKTFLHFQVLTPPPLFLDLSRLFPRRIRRTPPFCLVSFFWIVISEKYQSNACRSMKNAENEAHSFYQIPNKWMLRGPVLALSPRKIVFIIFRLDNLHSVLTLLQWRIFFSVDCSPPSSLRL